jgi:hypothetical protein
VSSQNRMFLMRMPMIGTSNTEKIKQETRRTYSQSFLRNIR